VFSAPNIMKIQIKLDYNDKVYSSNTQECTEEDVKEAKDLIKKISEGKVTHLSVENGFEEFFFTKSILEMSIITVIVT
jgi:hypothetical protein